MPKVFFVIFYITITVFRASDCLADALKTFDRTEQLVTRHFYDQTFRGLPWPKLVKRHRDMLGRNSSDVKLSESINNLLGLLNASHTEFLTSSDQSYWALKSIFSAKIDEAKLNQIGAWFQCHDKKWFVKNVFEGSPAYKAGLLPGDEIISINGKPPLPIESFSNQDEVEISLRRIKNGEIFSININTVTESFQRTLLRASTNSYKVIALKNKRIAYFHLWAGTNDEFKKSLKKAALQASLESDLFILDLRDGFGGAYPEYLTPFVRQNETDAFYSKPLIVLTNDGVRSGKEWLAFILKEKKRATLIGSTTKGYFLAGKTFEIQPNRFLLYLAVAEDPSKPKIEGNGVSPDIEVKTELPYSQGSDPVLEYALKFATENH